MHQVVPTIYHLFWAKMPSQQSISQKKPWLEIGNRPFFPLHQTTLSVNLLTVGLPPLYWLDTGWWCSDHGVIVPLLSLSLFFFFFSILLLLINFVSFCSCVLSAHAYPLWRMTWAYWACPTFASSWACRPACCYFLLGWPLRPYFFLSFL